MGRGGRTAPSDSIGEGCHNGTPAFFQLVASANHSTWGAVGDTPACRAAQGDNYDSCATDKMVGKKPITAVLWRYFTESTEGQTVATRSRRAVVDVELARDSRVALETRAAVARLIGAQSGQNRRTDTAVKTRIVLYTAHTHRFTVSTFCFSRLD